MNKTQLRLQGYFFFYRGKIMYSRTGKDDTQYTTAHALFMQDS